MSEQESATNPALRRLGGLVGDWQVVISNASFLANPRETIRGHASFYWVLDGAFLVMHQGDRPPSPPAALWLIGRDEASDGFEVLYFDSRQVSRIYHMTFDAQTWTMWREAPGFWQRFECTLGDDGHTMTGRWNKSTDNGSTWEHDFDVAYVRE